MRISDWSSDVCSSDLGDEDLRRQYIASIPATGGRGSRGSLVLAQRLGLYGHRKHERGGDFRPAPSRVRFRDWSRSGLRGLGGRWHQSRREPLAPTSHIDWSGPRSEEHTSELQSLMRISYAVFCLKKKTTHQTNRSY